MDWVSSVVGYMDIGQFAPRWILLLADGALKASLILLVAGVVTLAMRAASAATRHAVWAMALGSVLVLPMLATLLPSWDLGLISTPVRWASSDGAPRSPVLVMERPQSFRHESPMVVPHQSASHARIPRTAGEGSRRVPEVESSAVLVVPRPPPAPPAPSAAPPVAGGSLATNQASVAGPSRNVFVFLVGLWVVGLCGVMATLFAALYKVNRLERKAVPVVDPRWISLVNRIRHRLGITRSVAVVRSESVGTPATWGVVRPVVMIPADADSWSDARKKDVLVHELAHVKRYDFLTQMISRYACAIFWFNPFVWLAARQLRVERERACDDEVLATGTKASTYAGHLLEIARSIRGHSAAGIAAVSMAHRSQLTGRLLAVLEEGRPRDSISRRASVILWLSAVALLLPIVSVRAVGFDNSARTESPPAVTVGVPSMSMASATPAAEVPVPSLRVVMQQQVHWASAPECRESAPGSESRGINSNSNDERHTIRWWDDDCEGEVRIRGVVEFTSDFSDIASIARNGLFALEIDADGDSRRVEIRPIGQALERRWFVNGREEPYGAEAEAWLPAALEDLFRHSSIAIEERVVHILATRGVQGLIDQAGYSHGSYLVGRYYAAAIETGQLEAAEISQLLQRAINQITSDFEMARLLMSISANELRDPSLRRAYVEASETISSDFEKRRVLTSLLRQPALETDIVRMLLGSVQDIQSDFELASLLMELGPEYLNDPDTRDLYLRAAQNIQSDFELRRTLSNLLQRDNLSIANLRLLLQAATSINSDFEAATLLIEVAERYVVEESLRPLYFQSVDSISSDFEKRRVLNALMNSEQLGAAFIPTILNSGSTIGSDFELAELLTDLVSRYDLSPAMRPAFFQTLETIQSDFEQQRVLIALISKGDLPADVVTDAIRSTASLSSDFSKATVLTRIATRYRNNDAIRVALENAADTISSDHEYGRVMAAIRGRGNE